MHYLIASVDQETIFRLAESSAQDGAKVLAGEAIASEAQGGLASSFRSLAEFRIGCLTGVPVFLLAIVCRPLSATKGHPQVIATWSFRCCLMLFFSLQKSFCWCFLTCLRVHLLKSDSLPVFFLFLNSKPAEKGPSLYLQNLFFLYCNKTMGMISHHNHSSTHTWGSNCGECTPSSGDVGAVLEFCLPQ